MWYIWFPRKQTLRYRLECKHLLVSPLEINIFGREGREGKVGQERRGKEAGLGKRKGGLWCGLNKAWTDLTTQQDLDLEWFYIVV